MGPFGKVLKREVSRVIAWVLLLLALVLYPLLLGVISLMALVFLLKGGIGGSDQRVSGGKPGT